MMKEYNDKNVDKCLEWIRTNNDLTKLSIKDVINLSFKWIDFHITDISDKELERRAKKKERKEEEENTRIDYVVETDEKGVDWYVCQHWYHQRNSSRKLKEGDIINFEGTHENGMMLIRSFDYDSDFAARSYCQIYVWNKELHYSEGVQFGSNMAPSITKFSLASADDIQVFFNTIKKEFPDKFDFYFGPDFKYRERYAKYID